MLELGALGPITTILLILCLTGVLGWGGTQIIKECLLVYHDYSWFNVMVRTIAILIGAILGHWLLPGVIGALLGACGGVLNTTIVAVVKKRLKEVDPQA